MRNNKQAGDPGAELAPAAGNSLGESAALDAYLMENEAESWQVAVVTLRQARA